MKIIRIIFLSFLAVSLIAVTGIFIFFQTFDTDQYLPQITKKASLVLGRPVSVEHVGLGLSSRGITLDAWPVTVADDQSFTTTQPFIKVDRVRISLDLRSLIFQRKIHITGVLLQSPQIHFIRSQEGHLNIQSVGQASRFAGESDVLISSNGKGNPQDVKPVVGGRSKLGDQTFKSITIQDASISFIDQNQAMPLDIWLSGINARLNDFSPSEPFRLSFDACLYSNVPNIQVNALVFLNLSKRSVQINDLSLHTDLSRLDIDRLKDISPEIADKPFFKDITGVIQFNIAHLEFDPSGDLKVNGVIIITDGIIKDFNALKTVLSHALGSFGIGGSVDNLFKGPLKDKLDSADTIIKKAQAQFAFHDKTVFIDDSLLQTNIFELSAKGSVDQGLNTDMQTMLHLNNDISTILVNEFDGLKFLCDDSKRITIGASLKGVIPHLKYKPNKDFRKKGKKALMQEGGNILGILLGGGKQ